MFCFCFHFHFREEGGDLLYQSSNWIKENSTLCPCPAWRARELESSHHLRSAEEADLQWGARFSRASGEENVGTLMKIEHGWKVHAGENFQELERAWRWSQSREVESHVGYEISELEEWLGCPGWTFVASDAFRQRASLPVRVVHYRAWSNWSFEIFNNLVFFSCCFPFLIYLSWPSTLGQFLFIFSCRESLLTSSVLL